MKSLIIGNRYFFVFACWIFLSPFYYFPNFLTGDLNVALNEDFLHRLLKYVVAFFICFFVFLRRLSLNNALFYLFLSVFLIAFLLLGVQGFETRLQVALLLVLLSFSGFIFFSSYMSDEQLDLLLRVIVCSSVCVSLISFYEYFFMWHILGEYWSASGGYRSVSTMLNPNNLGVYLGVSILILLLRNLFSVYWRVLAIAIIFTAMLMSGSRTAVVSLVVPVFLGLMFSKGYKIKETLNKLQVVGHLW